MDEQSELGRHVDDGTMEWWGRQKKEIQDEAFGDHERTSVMDAIKQLNKFSVGVDEFWCPRPCSIMQYCNTCINRWKHLYGTIGKLEIPRTVSYYDAQDPRKGMQTDLHNALADCYYPSPNAYKKCTNILEIPNRNDA